MIHVRMDWLGIITRFTLISANIQELNVVYELVEDSPGLYLEDRNF